MLQSKVQSKRDIYSFCPIAIRIRTSFEGFGPADYAACFDASGYDFVRGSTSSIDNFSRPYPASTMNVLTPHADPQAGFIVLEHESGPEIFVFIRDAIHAAGDPAASVATWLGLEVAKKIVGMGVELALKPLVERLKKWFAERSRSKQLRHDPEYHGNGLSWIEIRSGDKGVLRIAPDDFDVAELACVLQHFQRVKTLDVLRATCFQGKEVEYFSTIDMAAPHAA